MHLVGFIIKKFVTVHSHTNVKYDSLKCFENFNEKLYAEVELALSDFWRGDVSVFFNPSAVISVH